MSEPRTTTAAPVHVVDPLVPPEPGAGCDVCSALARERGRAAGVGDWSIVADCNVELLRHHEDHS